MGTIMVHKHSLLPKQYAVGITGTPQELPHTHSLTHTAVSNAPTNTGTAALVLIIMNHHIYMEKQNLPNKSIKNIGGRRIT